MKKLVSILLALALCGTLSLVLAAPVLASPDTWEKNTGTEAQVVGDTITLGEWGEAEAGSQPVAVHGVTMALPPAAQIYVEFTYDLYAWDSYNAVGTPNPPWLGGTGYWDSFSVSVSQDKYWNLSLTDPLDGDPLDVGFLWGGTSYGDGNLESTSGSGSALMTASPTSTNYLNVVLDTATSPEADINYPSYGEFEITRIEIIGAIDIKPWSDPNSINTKSKSVVPVAILGSAGFDVTAIDPATLDLYFGPDGATPAHDITDPAVFADHIVYPWQPDPVGNPGLWYTANEDNIPDLVVHFRQQDTGLAVGDTEANLMTSLSNVGQI